MIDGKENCIFYLGVKGLILKGGLLCRNGYCRQQACFLYVSLSNERHGIWVKIIKNIKQTHGKSLLHLALCLTSV